MLLLRATERSTEGLGQYLPRTRLKKEVTTSERDPRVVHMGVTVCKKDEKCSRKESLRNSIWGTGVKCEYKTEKKNWKEAHHLRIPWRTK